MCKGRNTTCTNKRTMTKSTIIHDIFVTITAFIDVLHFDIKCLKVQQKNVLHERIMAAALAILFVHNTEYFYLLYMIVNI